MKSLSKLKLKLHLKALPLYIIVIANIFIIAYFTERYIEAICFTLSFLCLRYKFDKTYHANKTGTCMFITLTIVYLSVPNITKLNITLFGGVGIAFVGTFIAWVSQLIVDLIAENVALKKRNELLERENARLIKNNEKNLLEMSQEEFETYCKHKGLMDDEIMIANLFIRKGLKGAEFYSAIGYSVAQSKRKRKTILEKLNKN